MHSIFNLKYSVPKKIPIVFQNGFNYDFHFIMKELAEEFKKTIYLFRRKHWKIHNLYSSNRKRSYEIDENGEEITKHLSYISSSLSNLANNLSEGLPRIQCKSEHDNKM